MDPMSPMSGLGPGGHNGPDSPHGSGPGTPLGGTVPLGPPSHPDPALGFPGPAPSPALSSAPSPAHPGAGPGFPGAPSPAHPGAGFPGKRTLHIRAWKEG